MTWRGNLLNPLSEVILHYWTTKEFRTLCNKSPEFVDCLLDFATLPRGDILPILELRLEEFTDEFCEFKNGRIKPASIDHLRRSVAFEMRVY
jgi:hypothetical protein